MTNVVDIEAIEKMVWVVPDPRNEKRVVLSLMDHGDCGDATPYYHRETLRKRISELPNFKRDVVDNPKWKGWGYNYKADESYESPTIEIFSVPKKVDIMRVLNAALCEHPTQGRLGWHPDLVKWIKEDTTRRQKITDILNEKGGSDLPHIMETNRKLWRALCMGPLSKNMTVKEKSKLFREEDPCYQTTDTKFLAACPNPLNGNQPGVGKTIETIAAVIEAQVPGPWLVVCPMTAINTVWAEELSHWQEDDFYLVTGSKPNRGFVLSEIEERYNDDDRNFWVVCNPEMIRYKGHYDEDSFLGKKRLVSVSSLWPVYHEINWGVVILDEFHRMGMGNTATLTSRAFRKIKAEKKIALSGTPMGGKPIKLFGILQWLEPKIFTSKHEFGTSYLKVESKGNPFQEYENAVYGDVRESRDDAFQEMLSRYMVRHLKSEVAPWLPDKLPVHHEVEMVPAQKKQYGIFRDDAEIAIEEFSLGAIGILAEYTRLKQFADAEQTIEKVGVKVDELTGMTKDVLKLTALPNSGKLIVLEEILAEIGLERSVRYAKRDEQVIIFTQFTSIASMLRKWLGERDLRVGMITGEVKLEDRDYAQKMFWEKSLDIMVMNTMAGGVAINLETANTVVFFDETWNPDDQEQAADRAHRPTKTSQVTVHYIRSIGTVEHHIHLTTQGKSRSNWNVLDARRMGFRA